MSHTQLQNILIHQIKKLKYCVDNHFANNNTVENSFIVDINYKLTFNHQPSTWLLLNRDGNRGRERMGISHLSAISLGF